MEYEPIFVGWDLTNVCNLRCKHCNRSAGEKLKNELSLKEIKNIINQLSENFDPIEHLSFGGGEPLLRKNIFEIIDYAIKKGLPIRINTNGTIITPKLAKKLKALGVYHVQVSIDGKKENHNLIRGKGAFEKSIQGIRLLVDAGLSVSIRMTLFKNNYLDAEALYDLSEKLGVERFSVGRGICSGRLKENKEIYLQEKDYFVILEKLYEKAKSKKVNFYSTDPLALFSHKKRMNVLLEKYDLEESIGGCIAGIAQFFISTEGKVYGCGLLEIEAGNLKKQTILDIWKNSKLFNELRDRKINPKQNDFCGDCKYLSICGGCRAAAYYEKGKLYEKDPFCNFKE